MNQPGKVYAAIAAVAAEISKSGIAKGRRNTQQGYQFRGIDDVYNALAPMLAAHQLCILPRVTERTCVERATRNGGALFYTVVRVEFDFVCALDGSTHTASTYGEAMDSADKSTNKAMSAAYKYVAMQAFCIPTEGDNDADATTHQDVEAATPERVKRLAEATGSKLDKICQTYSVECVEDMTGEQVAHAIAILERKKAKQSAAHAGEAA